MPLTPIQFDPSASALLVIDAQNDLLASSGLFSREGWHDVTENEVGDFVTKCNELVGAMRRAKRPVIFVRTEFRADYIDAALAPGWQDKLNPSTRALVEGSQGAMLLDSLDFRPEDVIIVKKGQDAFQGTNLDRILTNLGARQCMLAGTDLLHSISNTLRQGRALGYDFYHALALPDHIATSLGARGRLEESLSFDEALNAVESRPVTSKPQRSALLVIDMQNDFFGPDRHPTFTFPQVNNEQTVENNRRFAQEMRDRGLPVIFARLFYRSDAADNVMTKFFTDVIEQEPAPGHDAGFLHKDSHGADFVPGLGIQDGDIILDKKGHSAFGLTYLHRMLRNLDVDHCYVSGGASTACVSETVRDAVALGYDVTVLEDAVYPANSPHVQEVLAKYARILTTNAASEDLQHRLPLQSVELG